MKGVRLGIACDAELEVMPASPAWPFAFARAPLLKGRRSSLAHESI
jgi:hypothetical protein